MLGDWYNWNVGYLKSVHKLNIVTCCYGFLSAILTAIGVFLIYRFVKKIVSFYQNQIKINWVLFIVHFVMVATLCASQMIFILNPKNYLFFYIALSLAALDQLMICYIVATYSAKKSDPLFIGFKDNGDVFFQTRFSVRLQEKVTVEICSSESLNDVDECGSG